MNSIVTFIIGLFVGTFIGVATMCLFQINSINRMEHNRDKNSNSIKKKKEDS